MVDDLLTCYYCLDVDEESEKDLIAPCSCKTYVHRKCLDEFRRKSYTPTSVTHCSVCKDAYQYEKPKQQVPSCCEWQILFCSEIVSKLFLLLLMCCFTGLVIFLVDSLDDNLELAKYVSKCLCVPSVVSYLILSMISTITLLGFAKFIGCLQAPRRRTSNIETPLNWHCNNCVVVESENISNLLLVFFIFGVLLFFLTGIVLLLNMVGAAANVATTRLYERKRKAMVVIKKRVKDLRPLETC